MSSALSFYFVYDFCLGPQFSAISAYFIRFIPFLVSVAVTIPVIVFRYIYVVSLLSTIIATSTVHSLGFIRINTHLICVNLECLVLSK